MPRKKETMVDKHRGDSGGLFIPAGIFVGLGLGFFLNNMVGGLFVGLGLGFVVFAIVRLAVRN